MIDRIIHHANVLTPGWTPLIPSSNLAKNICTLPATIRNGVLGRKGSLWLI